MHVIPPLFYSVKKAPVDALEPVPLLLLLHGHGGNERSMDALADKVPGDWKIVSLRAPTEISPGRFKWYTVDRSSRPLQINLAEEASSRQAILNTVNLFCKDPSTDLQRVVLAGFSQGAIMALCCGLTSPRQVTACAVFSGRFLQEIRPYVHPAANNLRVLLAHGQADPILPVRYAQENRAALQELGITADYVEDDSGHTLSPLQQAHFIQWLSHL